MEKAIIIKPSSRPSLTRFMDEMSVNEAYRVDAKASYARQLQHYFKSHTTKRFRVWTKKGENDERITFVGRTA